MLDRSALFKKPGFGGADLSVKRGEEGGGGSCDLCEAGSHVSTRAEQQQARKKKAEN